MAFSPTDPASAHSLRLQLRSTHRKRPPRWRSDWTPVWVSQLLLSLLSIFYAVMPSNDAAEQAKQTSHEEAVLTERPSQGELAP